ncbi:hypothetical protein ColKHC_03501 [Colletotrichum higginsianum]|nr:hypothetical protein ColKHC_03501 [Colletotrichum higginsianum]
MSDDEFTGPDGPPGSAGGDRDKRAPRFSWTPAYETTFFRSLCDSVQLGLRENHSFKADAWDRAATALREKHSAYPTKSHLVNKSDNARKKFRLWRGLREDPEFLYNPTNRTVTASEEAWKAHIEFMEILYPDVIGSGGAPKRIMKPKRKGPDVIQGSEDPDMPGTAVLDLQTPTSDSAGGGKAPTAPMGPPTQPAEKRRRVSGYTNPAHASGSNALSSHGNDASSASMASAGKQLMEDGLIRIADALRGRSPPRWPEQAIDIFFRDFSDEDMDLQLKIAEKALADDNKAMIFCKMSPALRKHWVKRLRELHNNSRNT